jgi:hypothetical protein
MIAEAIFPTRLSPIFSSAASIQDARTKRCQIRTDLTHEWLIDMGMTDEYR